MTDECKFITDFLGCDCELFENETNDEAVISRRNRRLAVLLSARRVVRR
jgi:hypothetical protein